MAPRERAIEIIEECRDIHVQWADWQESDPDWRDQIQAEGKNSPGGPEHHREWVAKYDLVLGVLRAGRTEQIIWLAGLLEGEGCFHISVSKKQPRCLYPSVKLSMNDEDVVTAAAQVMCTVPHRYHGPSAQASGRKPVWYTGVAGRRAVALIRDLYPLLGARRRARIDEILAECDPDGTKYPA